jgi:hypothetical protein
MEIAATTEMPHRAPHVTDFLIHDRDEKFTAAFDEIDLRHRGH